MVWLSFSPEFLEARLSLSVQKKTMIKLRVYKSRSHESTMQIGELVFTTRLRKGTYLND